MSSRSVKDSKIAVITAPNVSYANPGMATVDLAFESVLNHLDSPVTANWYCLHGPADRPIHRSMRNGTGLPFRFRPLLDELDQVYNHDAIVFWGDFMHTRHYIEQDEISRLCVLNAEPDRKKARQLLHRALLFRDAPDDTFSRVVLYGGTIMHNSQADYADEEYYSSFRRFMAQCRYVWLRDPLSAAKASHLRTEEDSTRFGADAALLLHGRELAPLPVTGWSEEITAGSKVGVFVGKRTTIPPWFSTFCRRLADHFSVKLEWLPWPLAEPPKDLNIPSRGNEFTFGDLLASLPKYRFIISDTYHLCLNAWRSGTPAVCIGSPQPGRSFGDFLSLNDLKKHVFYVSYDATDLYVSTLDDFDDQREAQFKRILQVLEHGAESIAHRINQHAERSRKSLTSTLESFLAR